MAQMSRSTGSLGAWLAVWAVCAVGCQGEAPTATAAKTAPAPAREIVVLAAASLTEGLEAAASRWTAAGNPAVVFSFDASSRLAKQIEAGAAADLFFSADEAWMDWAQARSLIRPETRRAWLGNRLVAIVPASPAPSSGPTSNPTSSPTLTIRAPADLLSPSVQRLALAGEEVPAGRYAAAALGSGIAGAKDRIVRGDSVRAVLGWVAAGEADAGVVYATDARAEPRVAVAFTFAPDSHPPIRYPAAILSASPSPDAATAFLAWCMGDEGRAIFTEAGFAVMPGP